MQLSQQHEKTRFHRLVAGAFIENPQNKPFVNHINCLKFDNVVDNLEWCTRKENQKHAVENNRYNPIIGEKSNLSKIKSDDVVKIRKLYSEGVWQKNIAAMFGISQNGVCRIVKKQVWKHIK